MKQQIIYKTLQITLSWIVKIWFAKVPNSLQLVTWWCNTIEKLMKANGAIFTIQHIKFARFLVMAYLSGNPIVATNERVMGINKSTKLPKILTPLHGLIISGDITSLRFVFTLLSVSRLIPASGQVNFDSLTQPSASRYQTEFEISRYMDIFLSQYKTSRLSMYFRKDELFYSAKSGPNGEASITALRDLWSLSDAVRTALLTTNIGPLMKEYMELLSEERIEKLSLVQKWWSILRAPWDLNSDSCFIKDKNGKRVNKYSEEFIRLYNKKNYYDRLSAVISLNKSRGNNSHEKCSRKLAIICDPEAKARVIAIFDHWSQTWLRQIHDIQFKLLRQIEEDRTFSQDPIIPKPPLGHKYYSFDLTKATDRFPLTLQRSLIEKMFGIANGKTWETILIDTPFSYASVNPNKYDTKVSYNAGQPMGAYSSWSTFTLCHHIILHYIHDKLSIVEKHYIILGDDIVIWHDDVAQMYQEIMKELGVGISLPKSHISSNLYEFAKRIFLNGQEITGIQVRGFYSNLNKYHLVYQMVFGLIYEKGYIPVKLDTIPSLMGVLFTDLGFKDKVVKNLIARTRVLHALFKYLRFDDVESFNNELKHRYPNHSFMSLPALEINNLIYLANDKAINSTTAKYIGYIERLIKNPNYVEMLAVGLASESDLYTSPQWYATQFPILQELGNLASSLNRSRKLESVKDLIRTLSLPGEEALTFGKSTELIGAAARLAKITLAVFENTVIQGSLAAMPSPNMTSTVLSLVSADVRQLKVEKHHGLIPGKLIPDVPKPDPYGSGVAMW
jgi:hypothetical protein